MLFIKVYNNLSTLGRIRNKVMSLIHFLTKVYKMIVVLNMRVILMFLCIVSLLSTCMISSDPEEHTFFVDDSFMINVVVIVAFVAFFFLVKQISCNKRGILLIIVFTLSIVWVLLTRFTPRSDQMAIFAGVEGLRNKNYSLFDDGGYFMQNPQQFGLVFIYYLCSFLVSGNYVLTYQILNVLAIVLIYKKLGDICVHSGLDDGFKALMSLVGIIFFPAVMYGTFVYGTLLGLAFSLAAIDYEILFYVHPKKRYAVLTLLFTVIAIFAKSNYVIFIIAMLIYALLKAMNDLTVKKVSFVVLFTLAIAFSLKAPVLIEHKITGIEKGTAISSFAYIAMGLQESSRANGWFNGYNYDTYVNCENVQKDNSIEEIKERVKIFKNDPDYMREFFLLKLASQWNNPTFECFWINQGCDSDIEQNNFIKTINSKNGSAKAYGFLDAILMLTLVGALAFFLLEKDFDVDKLIFATIFIGGFIFHIFWEAKGQYALPYFILLFPYAIRGYEVLIERVLAVKEKFIAGNIKAIDYKKIIQFICIVVFILLIIGNKIDILSKDTLLWKQYLEM